MRLLQQKLLQRSWHGSPSERKQYCYRRQFWSEGEIHAVDGIYVVSIAYRKSVEASNNGGNGVSISGVESPLEIILDGKVATGLEMQN